MTAKPEGHRPEDMKPSNDSLQKSWEKGGELAQNIIQTPPPPKPPKEE